jgi:hypothetical protein
MGRGVKRTVPQRDDITTTAMGTSDPNGIFTLRLAEPVQCGPGEELTMEVNLCRVPPPLINDNDEDEDDDGGTVIAPLEPQQPSDGPATFEWFVHFSEDDYYSLADPVEVPLPIEDYQAFCRDVLLGPDAPQVVREYITFH